MSNSSEIVALHAETLQMLFSFGELYIAQPCAVFGGHVFTADMNDFGTIRVYSREGMLRHYIHGHFGSPRFIIVRRGYIYVIEWDSEDVYDDMEEEERLEAEASATALAKVVDDEAKPWLGRRVLAIDMSGTVQQEISLGNSSIMAEAMQFHGDELWVTDRKSNNGQKFFHIFKLQGSS